MRIWFLSHILRLISGVAGCCAILVLALASSATARGDALLDRAICVKLATEKQTMEAEGIQSLLAKPPADVIAQHGRGSAQKIKVYIDLSEKVLFQCPLNVLNATAAPLDEREKYLPPLPRKGPKRAGVALPRKTTIPLPVPLQRAPKSLNSSG